MGVESASSPKSYLSADRMVHPDLASDDSDEFDEAFMDATPYNKEHDIERARPYTYNLGEPIYPVSFIHAQGDSAAFTQNVYPSTASTTGTAFYTAASRLDDQDYGSKEPQLQRDSEYAQILADKSLWPVDPLVEQNWSGRGQHAEFKKEERNILNKLLEVKDVLGKGGSAVVESVKCRRILLARKTIFCSRKLTKSEAVDEVAHLSRLQYSHIVRIIGTYTLGKELSILTYPVAEHNLEEFLHTFSMETPGYESDNMQSSITSFFACLSNTLQYVHWNLVKHMDIKPQNILVRRTKAQGYKIYLTDFGISRSYQRSEETDTNGPTRFTRKYAAPEVIVQESRGFSADVFSLGCVFLEILASLYDSSKRPTKDQSASQGLQNVLNTNTDGLRSYSALLDRLGEHVIFYVWASPLEQTSIFSPMLPKNILAIIQEMISLDPKARPVASSLVLQFGEQMCCYSGSEMLEAIPENSG